MGPYSLGGDGRGEQLARAAEANPNVDKSAHLPPMVVGHLMYSHVFASVPQSPGMRAPSPQIAFSKHQRVLGVWSSVY